MHACMHAIWRMCFDGRQSIWLTFAASILFTSPHSPHGGRQRTAGSLGTYLLTYPSADLPGCRSIPPPMNLSSACLSIYLSIMRACMHVYLYECQASRRRTPSPTRRLLHRNCEGVGRGGGGGVGILEAVVPAVLVVVEVVVVRVTLVVATVSSRSSSSSSSGSSSGSGSGGSTVL